MRHGLKIGAHAGEGVRLHRSAVLLIAIAASFAQTIVGAQLHPAAGAQKLIQWTGAAKCKNIFPVMVIVDRHMPMHRVAVAHGGAAEGRQIRHNEIGHAQVTLVGAGIPGRVDSETKMGHLDFDGRRHVFGQHVLSVALMLSTTRRRATSASLKYWCKNDRCTGSILPSLPCR